MLVSVIIPTYNRKKWVSKAIDSVLGQTYKDIELIVVDDASDDGSYEYFQQKYGSKIILLQIEHGGVSKARNAGLEVAKGEWIAFLDSDDYFHDDKIEKQIALIRGNPGYQVAHSEEIWIRDGVRINPRKQHLKQGGDIFHKSVALCSISISTVIVHRDIFAELGVFDEDMPACEDYDLWLRVTAKYPVLFDPEYLITKFGGHEDQLSKKYYAMDRFRIYALDKIIKSGDLKREQEELAVKSLAKKLRIFLKGAKKHGNDKEYSEFKNDYGTYLAER